MTEKFRVDRRILSANEKFALSNRHDFEISSTYVCNLLSSPGAGKTSLLEWTVKLMKERYSIGVIEGDIRTENDSLRLRALGIPVVQINTGGACHLEASMVRRVLANFDLNELDILFIENVGNLVCPSSYDLGENIKIVIVSTPEGDDKPSKYPAIFRKSRLMIINKIDLLPYTDFNVENVKRNALLINSNLTVFETSCKTGEGLENWISWLEERISEM
ncbi:MAG: hydrogenase nickel incorporation protein HypB [Fidelibacterota bacterium]